MIKVWGDHLPARNLGQHRERGSAFAYVRLRGYWNSNGRNLRASIRDSLLGN